MKNNLLKNKNKNKKLIGIIKNNLLKNKNKKLIGIIKNNLLKK